LVRLRLEHRPREHPERDEPDAGLPHQRHVLAPDGGVPLLGVVVAAHRDAGEGEHVVLSSGDSHTIQHFRTETEATLMGSPARVKTGRARPAAALNLPIGDRRVPPLHPRGPMEGRGARGPGGATWWRSCSAPADGTE